MCWRRAPEDNRENTELLRFKNTLIKSDCDKI